MPRIAFLLPALLAPSVAMAEPITTLLATIGSAVGATGATAALAWAGAKVVFTVGMMVYGRAAQRRKLKKAAAAQRAQLQASLTDRQITAVSAERPHRTIYGIDYVGADVVAILPSGANDEFQHVIAVFAQHQVEDYLEFKVAGKVVPVSTIDMAGGYNSENGWVLSGDFLSGEKASETASFATSTYTFPSSYVAGSAALTDLDGAPLAFTVSGLVLTVTDAAYLATDKIVVYQRGNGSPRLNIQRHYGVPNEAADSFLMGRTPSKWTAAHKLSGHAYCVFTFDLRQAEFQNGLVEIQAKIKGKRLYDPRTMTTAWSDNPALVAYDYITGPFIGVSPSSIPVIDYQTGADDCDDLVGTPARKRYTFNGTVYASENRRGVLEAMAESVAGTIEGSTWAYYVGKYRSPVAALLQSDVVGSLNVTSGQGEEGTFNTVTGQYLGPETSYVATDFKEYSIPAYITADGERRAEDVQYPYTNNLQGIHDLAGYRLEDARNGLTVVGDFSLKAWRLRPGDRVTLTAPVLGMTAKILRVTDKSFSPAQPVQLSLKEDDPSIWDTAPAVSADSTPNTDLPDPFAVPMGQLVTILSGSSALIQTGAGDVISRIRLEWAAPAYRGALATEIQYQRAGTNVWEATTVQGVNFTYLSPVTDGAVHVVRFRHFNPTVAAYSPDWTYVNHTVLGKTEAPAAPTNFVVTTTSTPATLTLTPPPDLDYAGVQFRAMVGTTNIAWERATALHTGLVNTFPWQVPVQLYGVQTFLVKAFDWFGNESAFATVVGNFSGVLAENIGQSKDYDAEGYPGVLTACTVVSGDLLADVQATGNIDMLADQDTEIDLDASLWSAMTYETTPFVPLYGGGTLTLSYLGTGADFLVDYRIDGDTGTDLDASVNIDALSNVDGSSSAWQTWPGSLAVARGQGVQWRVSVAAGSVRGSVTSMLASLALQYRTQSFTDVVVPTNGYRCAPSAGTPPMAFVALRDVQITPAIDGSGATGGRYARPLDAAAGGLIELTNSSGSVVAGRATVLQGGLVDATA